MPPPLQFHAHAAPAAPSRSVWSDGRTDDATARHGEDRDGGAGRVARGLGGLAGGVAEEGAQGAEECRIHRPGDEEGPNEGPQ